MRGSSVSEQVMAWGHAGCGTGDKTIAFDDGTDPVMTDLSMQLGAIGTRGEPLMQREAGGMDLARKGDAFFVRTESDKAANSVNTEDDANRLRLVFEGGRSCGVGGGASGARARRAL